MSSTETSQQTRRQADRSIHENFGKENEDKPASVSQNQSEDNKHDSSSLVTKIRSRFSSMFSTLLPLRSTKDECSAPNPNTTPERGSPYRERYERPSCKTTATQTSVERYKRPLSPYEEESEDINNNNIVLRMPVKRRRLHESEAKAPVTLQAQYIKTPVAQNRRQTGLTGKSIFHNRMQQLRSGGPRKSLFGSPCIETTKGAKDSVASSQRPSFTPSVTRAARSLTSGYIAPEIGGSPFYQGFTRYGGASAAETLGTYISQRTSLTSLVRKNVPDAKRYPSFNRAGTREAYSTFLFSPKYTPSNARQLTYQSQQKYPPIVPLMEYTLPVAQLALQPPVPITPKACEPTGEKLRKKITRLHAQPLKEPNALAVQPFLHLPNMQLPPLKELPKFDFAVPLKPPALPVADKVDPPKAIASDIEIISLTDDEEETQEEKKKEEKNTAGSTDTLLRVIDTFAFVPPLVLGDYPAELHDNPVSGAIVKFKMSDPEPLYDPTVERFVLDLKTDTAAWECDICMVRNEPRQQVCSTCKNPNKKKEMHRNRTTGDHKTDRKASADKKPSERSHRWKCSECKVRNEPKVSVCVSCGKKNRSSRTTSTKDRSSTKHHSSREHTKKDETPKKHSSKDDRSRKHHSSKERTTKEHNTRSKSSTKEKPSSK